MNHRHHTSVHIEATTATEAARHHCSHPDLRHSVTVSDASEITAYITGTSSEIRQLAHRLIDIADALP